MEQISNTVFLSVIGSKIKRLQLATILQRAGMNVIPQYDHFSSAEEIKSEMEQFLDRACCSIHILDKEENSASDSFDYLSFAKYQFQAAKKKLDSHPDFKIFVWQSAPVDLFSSDAQHYKLLEDVLNNISGNMVYTDVTSSIQLVDDIRSMLEIKKVADEKINSTDVFLIFNQLDETEAEEIVDMLSDIIPVEKLSIVQDSELDYSEFCTQQIGVSKLAVVYFKNSTDWAVPFTQQIWKKIGGASSHTPILLIGDEIPDTNKYIKISAPKIICLIAAGELIPLEIKIQYDKAIGIE